MVSLKLARQGEIAVLSMTGDMDMDDVVAVKNAIASLLADQCCHLVLDMSRVQHIHAVGFGLLAESIRRLRSQKGDLRLASLNAHVKHTLELIGMARFLRMYENRAVAVDSYKAYEVLAA